MSTFNDYYAGAEDLLYSEADHRRIDDQFTLLVGYMTFMGQIPLQLHHWLPQNLWNLGSVISGFYCCFVIIQTGHLALLFTKTFYDRMTGAAQLGDITDALTMVVIYTFAFFANCYWLLRSQQLRKFLAVINREYRHHSLAGITFVSSYQAFAHARRMTKWWMLACILGVMLWALPPLVLGTHTLPLNCWYPFDPLQPGVYEVVYLMQIFGQLNVGITFGCGSALFVSIVIVMMGQFDVLYGSLKNFDYHARLLSGEDIHKLRKIQEHLPKAADDELNQYIFAIEHKTNLSVFGPLLKSRSLSQTGGRFQRAIGDSYERELHAALVLCIGHHRFLLDCCKELEELYNPFCFVKSMQITFQLCLLMFVGVAGERTSVRIINLIQYLALTGTELLMFTYYGELLSGHSVRGGEALWRADWWRRAPHLRQDIMMFLLHSRRAVKLTAGKFYAMDVERLRSVVTQSFSFFTLLQKLADKNNN